MKKFFEDYGFTALVAIVVISLISIAKPVGGGVQNATTSIVGSFKNQVVSATNEINNPLRPNSMIELGGRKYVILQNRMNNQYLVMDIDGIGTREFNTDGNGQDPNKCKYDSASGNWKLETCNNQYEGSNIDQYLNGEYYNSLPQDIKESIVEQEIQQNFYSRTWSNPNYKWVDSNNPLNPGNCTGWCVKQSNGNWILWYKHTPIKGEPGALKFTNKGAKRQNGYQANTIKRKVFLPSAKEVSQIVNVENQYEMQVISRDSRGQGVYTLLRDSSFDVQHGIMYIGTGSRSFENNPSRATHINTRPAFIIDLSKVKYTNLDQQFVK